MLLSTINIRKGATSETSCLKLVHSSRVKEFVVWALLLLNSGIAIRYIAIRYIDFVHVHVYVSKKKST